MNPFAAPPRLAKLTIEITTLCNLKCAGCPRTTAMAQGAWATSAGADATELAE